MADKKGIASRMFHIKPGAICSVCKTEIRGNVNPEMREILPAEGIWTIQDLALYTGAKPAVVQEKLSQMGVKTIHLGKFYKYRLFRLEELKIRKG